MGLPTASAKALDTFATSKSIVRNAAGSGGIVDMARGAGYIFAPLTDPRSRNRGASDSEG